MKKKARLLLSNGSSYEGFAFGFEGNVSGSLTCDCTMIGYTEVLTDPAYYNQLLVMTYPIIGNYGMPCEALWESPQITPKAVIVHDYTPDYSHWNAASSLGEAMHKEHVVGICGIDTHAITKELLQTPELTARIEIVGKENEAELTPQEVRANTKVVKAKGSSKILLADLGIKRSTLQFLKELGISYEVAHTAQSDTIAPYRALIVAGEGGGTTPVSLARTLLAEALTEKLPIYAAAQGYDLLSEIIGAELQHNQMIHHSLSEPILKIGTQQCHIISNSHRTSVVESTLPEGYQPLFKYLNGNENAGYISSNGSVIATTFLPNNSEMAFLLKSITSLK